MPRTPKTHPRWTGNRCYIIKAEWDDEKRMGRWTFECGKGHVWEENAIDMTRTPLRGKPHGRGAFNLYSRYWTKAGEGPTLRKNGCDTFCPICDPEFWKKKRRGLGLQKKILVREPKNPSGEA